LPGDDWDSDMNEERLILRTRLNPDPEKVKWISPKLERGEERDIVVNVGEPGGLWALDKFSGEFLWATPFPEDSDSFLLSDIDVNTGATVINRELILDRPGAHRIICYFNTRSYWPGAYSPQTNSLYMPYIKNCLNMTAAAPATETTPAPPPSRIRLPPPGSTPEASSGLANDHLDTGDLTPAPPGPLPTTSTEF